MTFEITSIFEGKRAMKKFLTLFLALLTFTAVSGARSSFGPKQERKVVVGRNIALMMVKNGKVYENMMINLAPSNEKLERRVIRIVCEILKCDEETAIARLEANEWNIRKSVEK